MAQTIRKERRVGPAPSVDVRDVTGASSRKISLDPQVFAIEPNVAVMHQVVNAQLAARRSGTQSTKTRAEVRGGGSKPWRQKGTGRARQGSTNSPHFTGGGVALGPKPRSYVQRTPKKMVQLALRSALSDRAGENKVIVIDRASFEVPKTKKAVEALAALQLNDSVLLVLGDDDETAYKSFKNLQRVHVVHESELNVFDVLRHDAVVFTESTLPSSEKTAAPETKGAGE